MCDIRVRENIEFVDHIRFDDNVLIKGKVCCLNELDVTRDATFEKDVQVLGVAKVLEGVNYVNTARHICGCVYLDRCQSGTTFYFNDNIHVHLPNPCDIESGTNYQFMVSDGSPDIHIHSCEAPIIGTIINTNATADSNISICQPIYISDTCVDLCCGYTGDTLNLLYICDKWIINGHIQSC